MSDGEGDQLLVLFRPEGCVLNGYLLGYDEPPKTDLTRGLPAAFREFLFGEPVASIGTTFCAWYTPEGGWQAGTVDEEDDGSEELLGIFDNNPTTYAEWATEYYTDETRPSAHHGCRRCPALPPPTSDQGNGPGYQPRPGRLARLGRRARGNRLPV